MIQLFKGFDADSIRTDVGAIARREVAAVSLFRRERLWDGTLRGAGIGAGKAVTMTAGLGGMKEDYAVAALLGSLTGAGLGALYDAAVARPDIPVFVNSPAGQPRPLTRAWQLRVARDELGGWVAGKDIQLMLKDGAFLRGKVSDVGEGKLSMQVKESSDPSLKNERLEVEIARIGAITLRERMGGSLAAGAVASGLSGFWLGASAGASASAHSNDQSSVLVGAGVGLAAGIVGAIGLDRVNFREITLLPE
jgi:hypothetical protein